MEFPGFNPLTATTVPHTRVMLLGRTSYVPLYQSECNYDAKPMAVCVSRKLTDLEVEVAFTPLAGEGSAWRLVKMTPTYSSPLMERGDLNAAPMEIGVRMRDASAPREFAAPALSTANEIYMTMALFGFGLVTAGIHPTLMGMVKVNVALNNNQRPPWWQEMARYRGW